MGVDALDRRSAMGRGSASKAKTGSCASLSFIRRRDLQQRHLAASALPASSHVNAGAPGTVHRALRGAFTAPDAV